MKLLKIEKIAVLLAGASIISAALMITVSSPNGALTNFSNQAPPAQDSQLTAAVRANTDLRLASSANQADALAQTPAADAEVYKALADSKIYADLPVGNVSTKPVENPKGVVVLIPQTHKYPGSNFEDAVNDDAEIAQNQIYAILKFLTSRFSLGLIVTEGDEAGPVSKTKLTSIMNKRNGIDLIKKISEKIVSVLKEKDTTVDYALTISKNAHTVITALEREMILGGAPFKLASEGVPLTLYGTEIASTIEEGKVVVRDHIYLQDRLAELNTRTPIAEKNQMPRTFNINQIIGLLTQAQSPMQMFLTDLQRIDMLAKENGDETVGSYVGELRKTLENMRQSERTEGQGIASQAPSRQNNPYSNIKSKAELEKLLKENEAKINSIVIEKRNTEAAQNTAHAMESERKSVAILQYGAGHEEGLVRELQKLHYSVIVITPQKLINDD